MSFFNNPVDKPASLGFVNETGGGWIIALRGDVRKDFPGVNP